MRNKLTRKQLIYLVSNKYDIRLALVTRKKIITDMRIDGFDFTNEMKLQVSHPSQPNPPPHPQLTTRLKFHSKQHIAGDKRCGSSTSEGRVAMALAFTIAVTSTMKVDRSSCVRLTLLFSARIASRTLRIVLICISHTNTSWAEDIEPDIRDWRTDFRSVRR